MDEYTWTEDASDVDFGELSELYRIAPLGIKPPDALATVFGHSMFVCFVYAGDVLAGAGRALADGLDCAYIADVAVHPGHQGRARPGDHPAARGPRGGAQEDHPVRQPGDRGLLPQAGLPAHEHGDGDLARPDARHRIRPAQRGTLTALSGVPRPVRPAARAR